MQYNKAKISVISSSAKRADSTKELCGLDILFGCIR